MKLFKSFLIITFLFLLLVGCNTTYNVSFVTDTDEVIDVMSIEKNGIVGDLPELLERDGFDFDGWYLDEEFSEEYVDQQITEDTTLYAKWVVQYTVTFMNGTEEFAQVIVNHGETAIAPADPTKVGHIFTSWDKDFSNVTSDLIVNATFDQESFDVTFMNGDTQIGNVQTVLYGEAATAPADPTKVGHSFVEWDNSFDNITGDLVVNAVFEILSYEVKFVDNTGTVLETQSVEYGQDATAPSTNPQVTGYTFTDWDQDFTNITGDLTINPQYTAITYDVEYYDDTTLLTHTPDTYNIELSVDLTGYDKEGYIFVGWYLQSDFSDEVVDNISSGHTGNLTFYGKWLDETDTLDINYELNGGSWTWSIETVTTPGNGIDEYSNLPEIFMIDFYTYLKDNDLLTSSVVDSSLHKTTWVDFKANYDDPVAIYNHTTTNTSATTNGYSQFFYTNATGNAETGELLTIEGGFFGSETYKAKYFEVARHLSLLQENKYSVNFWDGAAAKTLAGFILDGYFYGTQGAGADNFLELRKTIPNTDLGFTFNGTVLEEVASTYPTLSFVNGLKGELSTPSRDGHVFAGWYTTSDFTGDRVEIIEANTTPEAKYYAKWVEVSDY